MIGTGTGKALERKGILPDLIPDVYEARELGNTLAKKGDERGSGGGISGKGSIRRAVSTDT